MIDFESEICDIKKNISEANCLIGKPPETKPYTDKRVINGNKYELDKFKRSVSLINYRRNNKKHNLGKNKEIIITTDQNEFEDKMAKLNKLALSEKK